MKKDKMITLGVLCLVAIGGVYAYSQGLLPNIPTPSGDSMLQIGCRDAQGNFISCGVSSGYSVVQGTPSVYYMDFNVLVRNTGGVPITASISSMTPATILNAFGSGSKTIPIGGSDTFTTIKSCTIDGDCNTGMKCVGTPLTCTLPTDSLEALAQPITWDVTVYGTWTCPIGQTCPTTSLTKSGSMQFSVLPDPVTGGSFEIEITSSAGGSGAGGGTCLSSGTACTDNAGCCSGNCQSIVSTLKTPIPCSLWTSIIECNSTTNQARDANPYFTCPIGSQSCELYQLTDMYGTPIVPPALKATCIPDSTCHYNSGGASSNGPWWNGYSISTSVSYQCA